MPTQMKLKNASTSINHRVRLLAFLQRLLAAQIQRNDHRFMFLLQRPIEGYLKLLG